MPHDVVIRNGSVVDGSGPEPYWADVAVDDGRIVAVGHVTGAASRRSMPPGTW